MVIPKYSRRKSRVKHSRRKSRVKHSRRKSRVKHSRRKSHRRHKHSRRKSHRRHKHSRRKSHKKYRVNEDEWEEDPETGELFPVTASMRRRREEERRAKFWENQEDARRAPAMLWPASKSRKRVTFSPDTHDYDGYRPHAPVLPIMDMRSWQAPYNDPDLTGWREWHIRNGIPGGHGVDSARRDSRDSGSQTPVQPKSKRLGEVWGGPTLESQLVRDGLDRETIRAILQAREELGTIDDAAAHSWKQYHKQRTERDAAEAVKKEKLLKKKAADDKKKKETAMKAAARQEVEKMQLPGARLGWGPGGEGVVNFPEQRASAPPPLWARKLLASTQPPHSQPSTVAIRPTPTPPPPLVSGMGRPADPIKHKYTKREIKEAIDTLVAIGIEKDIAEDALHSDLANGLELSKALQNITSVLLPDYISALRKQPASTGVGAGGRRPPGKTSRTPSSAATRRQGVSLPNPRQLQILNNLIQGAGAGLGRGGKARSYWHLMEELRLRIHPASADGDCQFHAIRQSLEALGLSPLPSADELRKMAVDYIRKDDFLSQIAQANESDTLDTFDEEGDASQYFTEMALSYRHGGTWGDELTLTALAKLFNLSIYVIHQGYDEQDGAVQNINSDGQHPIILVYSGKDSGPDGDEGAHYDAVQDI